MAAILTDAKIRKLKPEPGARIEVADGQVPGLRVRASRGKTTPVRVSWYFTYRSRVTGKLVPIHLGGYPALTLSGARVVALNHRRQLDEGNDPREAEQQRRDAETPPETYTVAMLTGEFLTHAERTLAKKTMEDYRRYLAILTAKWGNRDAAAVGRGDVVDILDRQAEKGPRSAGHLLSSARAAWSHAVERERLESSPWVGLRRQSKAFKSRRKDRALSDAELRQLLRELPESGLPPAAQLTLKLLLWSGCRPNEVAAMEWREVNLTEAEWSIPAGRMKGRKPHMIPLPSRAVRALEAQRSAIGRGNFKHVMPAQNRLGHVDLAAVSKGLRRAFQAGRLTTESFTPHDLRRTTATGLARLGAPREVIRRILAHHDSTVLGVYQRHQYDEAAREWLQRWADHLEILMTPNVVSLSSAREA